PGGAEVQAHCRELLESTAPVAWPTVDGYFYVLVFLAALPAVRARHAELGVPELITRATLADLGNKMAIYRRTHGVGGLDRQSWLTRHFRGTLFRLGRLQFDMLGPVLDIHIPEDGPLTPAACDESFAAARPFFARHFGRTYRSAVCRSWLLDEQLAGYLSPDSNILAFQRRFQPTGQVEDGDHDIVEFVFRRHPADLSELPQRTALQRAVVSHLRGGGHWRIASGVAPLT
ncbi:MAG: acyltransferase domain-containing protein, partial [Actinoplanes sp.]